MLPFRQGMVTVRCYGQDLLLVETQFKTVERNGLMAVREVMEILPAVLFYILNANLSTKAIFLPKHMIVTLATNAFSNIDQE